MAFDAEAFKTKLAGSLNLSTASATAKPAPTPTFNQSTPTPFRLPETSPSTLRIGQSTPQTSTGIDTIGAIKLLNPLHKVAVRPFLNKAGQTQEIYGGPLVAGAHDMAARTLESIPNIALRTLANFSPLVNGGKPGKVTVPFDVTRLGFENSNRSELVGADLPIADAKKLQAEHEKQGKDASIQIDKNTGLASVYAQAPSNTITDTGTDLTTKFAELEKANPGKTKTNMALAILGGPVTDALNAFVAGDLLTASAKIALKATKYDPALDWALQTYGIKNSGLTGEDFSRELTRRFNQKATTLAASEDSVGLNQLGYATNIILKKLTGRGVPQLSAIGTTIENVARTGLQDAKYGFHLQHPMYPEVAPAEAVTAAQRGLPGTVEEPGQMPAFGLSTKRVRRVGGAEEQGAQPAPEPFQGFPDLTTKVLDRLQGRSTVSKQFIDDLTNAPDLKQPERDLIRGLLTAEGAQINVKDFADKVRAELLPLTRGGGEYDNGFGGTREGGRYEQISLPDDIRGPIANYSEHIYQSPVKTSAGAVHFAEEEGTENYFGHTRVEDLPDNGTRRVIEVQSDLFQKGRLENEKTAAQFKAAAGGAEAINEAGKDLSRLEPYKNNAAHFRMIREEVKQAAKDGKTKLQFPTGETAMKIEGLGQGDNFFLGETGEMGDALIPELLDKDIIGSTVTARNEDWVITDVLGDGKFKAIPKKDFDKYSEFAKLNNNDPRDLMNRLRSSTDAETFDISGKVDTENPIYKFYEKEVGRYLKNNYGAERVTDAQGQSWWEVPVKDEYKNKPVSAFGAGAGVQQDEDKEGRKRISYNPILGILGIVGSKLLGPEFRGLSDAILKELAEADASAVARILVAQGMRAAFAKQLAPQIAIANTPDAVAQVVADAIQELAPPSYLPNEDESYNVLAQQDEQWQPYLDAAPAKDVMDDTLTSVFADMKGMDVKDLEANFTDEDLDNARMHYDVLMDALLDHPGRALMKYVKRSGEFEGKLPDLKKGEKVSERGKNLRSDPRTEWERRGDDIFQDLVGQERSQGGDVSIAQDMVDDYLHLRDSVAEVQQSLRYVRKTIRLQKLKGQFIESSKRALARETIKDAKALKNLVEAANRAGYEKGLKVGKTKVENIMTRLKGRRQRIVALQHIYDLSDKQMRAVTKEKDWRLIPDKEFDTWFQELEPRAVYEQQKDIQKQIIGETIESKELNKTENLRAAMELPPIGKMDLQQLQEFEAALAPYQTGDTFLGPRMIQTIENTDLAGAKTWREVKQKLAEDTGTDVSTLSDVRGGEFDIYTFDQGLMGKNPLYKYMVSEFAAKDVENARKLHAIQQKLDQLATAARRSRPRVLTDKLVPQDLNVFRWLETPEEEQPAFAKVAHMTQEEFEYAKFVKALYREWRDILIQKEVLKKWRDSYITHTPRSFFERWKEAYANNESNSALTKSLTSLWESIGGALNQFSDARVDFPAVGDTGEVLGLEKFFKYSLPRGKDVVPSKNVARVVMQYARTFYKKDALDQILPKVEAYTLALRRSPGPGIPRDPTGLNVDGNLKEFIKQWLNNKKGRQLSNWGFKQGGRLDLGLRLTNWVVTMHDLGFNLIAQPASVIGELQANFIGMDVPEFVEGARRLATKRGREVAAKYPGVVGEPPFERLISAANDIGDTFMAGAYYIFQEVSYRAREQFFLGLLTPEEYSTGIVSPKRQGEIKNYMGNFRPLEGNQSVAGSTSFGKILTKYKTWAVPLLSTVYRNTKTLQKMLKESTTSAEKTEAFKSKEARQLFKQIVSLVGIYVFFSLIFGDSKNDKSFVGRLKKKILQELSSGFSVIDPNTWTQIRMYEFLKDLGKDIHVLMLAEKYESSGPGYEKGDLKGPRALVNDVTPALIRQFIAAPEESTSNSSSSTSKGSDNPSLERLKNLRKRSSPATNPALERLKALRERSASNPALERLKALRSR